VCVCLSTTCVILSISLAVCVCVFDYYGSLQGIGSRRKKELDGATSLCNTNPAAIRFFLFRGIALTFYIPVAFSDGGPWRRRWGKQKRKKKKGVEGGAGSWVKGVARWFSSFDESNNNKTHVIARQWVVVVVLQIYTKQSTNTKNKITHSVWVGPINITTTPDARKKHTRRPLLGFLISRRRGEREREIKS
jgi:hypothetical protein